MSARVGAQDVTGVRAAEAAGATSPPGSAGTTDMKSRAALVGSGALLLAACGSLWNYVGAILHRNALAYSHAFFMEDILPTYNAARQILAGHGASMYDPAVVHGYTYSPVFALLFVPLALLPWSIAQVVWYGLCQVWLWLAIGALARLFGLVLPPELTAWRVRGIPAVPALAAVWLGLAPSVQASLDFGQVDYLILALLAMGVVHLVRGHDARGAVFICLAGLLKITPLGLLSLFLLGRRWRALIGAVLTLAVCALVTAALPAIGIRAWLAMRGGVDANLTFIFGQYANESVGGIAAHVLAFTHVQVGPHAGEYLGLAVAGALFVPIAYRVWRWSADTGTRFGALVAGGIGAVLLSSPLNWDHSFVAGCVPTAVLLGFIARECMASAMVRVRHLAGALAATVLASWPSTAGLMADPGAGIAHRIGDLCLIAGRPVALASIICLLLWYLAREAGAAGAAFAWRQPAL